MQTQQAPSTPPSERWRPSGPLIAAVAVVAVIVAGGIAIALLSADETEVATTVAADAISPAALASDPAALASEFAAAINQGDLEAALAILSPQSNCDFPIPGSEVETCEQWWGHNIAIGASVTYDDCIDPGGQFACTETITTELQTLMGYPGRTVSNRIPLVVDADGLLVIDNTVIDVTNPFLPFDVLGWMASYLASSHPDFVYDYGSASVFMDHESGVAMMEVARQINDPARIVDHVQTSFDKGGFLDRPWAPRRCDTQDGVVGCDDLAAFLQEVAAEVRFDCATGEAARWAVACSVTIDSDIHAALGSDPTNVPAEIEYTGGLIDLLVLDLRFADDPLVHDAFMAYARGVDGLYGDGDRPVYTPETASLWLAAAAAFAGQ